MWHLISIVNPPLNVIVRTKVDDGNEVRNEQLLRYDGKLWWTAGLNSTYIYYTPTHWRY